MVSNTRPELSDRYAVLVHDGCIWYGFPDRRQAEMMVERLEREGQDVSLAVIDYTTVGAE